MVRPPPPPPEDDDIPVEESTGGKAPRDLVTLTAQRSYVPAFLPDMAPEKSEPATGNGLSQTVTSTTSDFLGGSKPPASSDLGPRSGE